MTTNDPKLAKIRAYNAKREAMLLKGDPQALIDFQIAHNLPVAKSVEVAEIMLHKARTGCNSLPWKPRRASWVWLTKRGYSTWDDGDLAVNA